MQNNTIKALVIMLPIKSFQYDRKALAISNNKIGINEWMPANSIQQHLYFISVEKQQIKVGNWIHRNEMIFKASIADADEFDYYVIASTDSSLGLPAIPTTWIRDVYVPSNGSIKEVKLEQDFREILDWDCIGGSWQVKLTSNNEVVIVDEPKHTISKHDAWNNAKLEGMEITHPTAYGYQSKKSKEILAKTPVEVKEKVKNFMDKIDNDQELEDAANNWVDSHYNKGVEYSKAKRGAANPKSGFIAGAEWQKEQSATDAIEFAKWTQQNDWWYIDKHDYWMEGKWFDTELERFPSYTSKQLYELWQQSKNK